MHPTQTIFSAGFSKVTGKGVIRPEFVVHIFNAINSTELTVAFLFWSYFPDLKLT
ncbi:hypothetical protein M595_5828 [Lyngbya aestuarii BL J]|uniref:Uncharacterized protein n=1 Tax=Lyngbya aestuarii BL J TaxID=1348334 RepID=U7QB00_9CYAN|nr:hypothetical protein M595_5828 [Lyngbya aestuarii BL J]